MLRSFPSPVSVYNFLEFLIAYLGCMAFRHVPRCGPSWLYMRSLGTGSNCFWGAGTLIRQFCVPVRFSHFQRSDHRNIVLNQRVFGHAGQDTFYFRNTSLAPHLKQRPHCSPVIFAMHPLTPGLPDRVQREATQSRGMK